MKKKLLIVNKQYFPDLGGVETVVDKYYSLLKEEFEITILCCSRQKSKVTQVEVSEGLKIVRCSSFGTYKSMPVSLSFVFHFFKEISRVDIVNFHYPFPIADFLAFFYRGRKKFIVTWHSDIVKQKLIKKAFRLFTSNLLGRSRIITTSKNLRNRSEFLSNYKDVTVVPLSISPTPKLPYLKIEDHFGRLIPNEYVLFQGRLAYYKGIDVLLNAYKDGIGRSLELPKLVISGDGELKEHVKNFITENELSHLIYPLLRFVSEEEKTWLFQNCKYFVFPSTHNSEAFGIVQLEALSEGKPVINTYLDTGVPWVSQHNVTGLTVSPNSSIELLDAILFLENNPSKYLEYSRKAKARFNENFSDEIIKQELFKIFMTDVS